MGAVGWAVGHLGGVAAAAQAMSLTGFDQANFGKDLLEIIGHGWAHVARMKSGKGGFSRIASGLRPIPRSAPSPIYGRGLGRGFGVGYNPISRPDANTYKLKLDRSAAAFPLPPFGHPAPRPGLIASRSGAHRRRKRCFQSAPLCPASGRGSAEGRYQFTQTRALRNMRIQPPSSCHSSGRQEFCTARNTRSGCGIMMVTRPSRLVRPVIPRGEPLGLAG